MKYNSVENAEVFLKEQVEWCLTNGYKDFSIWSNGKELRCLTDEKHLTSILSRVDAEREGFWRAFRMVDGKQVSVFE